MLNTKHTKTSANTTNANSTGISDVSPDDFKAFCRFELLKGDLIVFEIKSRHQVELLIKIEDILGQSKWDLTDDLLVSLLNKFIRLYNNQEIQEMSTYLQKVDNIELDIVRSQPNIDQKVVDREVLLQKMVCSVALEETYFGLLNELIKFEAQKNNELNKNHTCNDRLVVEDVEDEDNEQWD